MAPNFHLPGCKEVSLLQKNPHQALPGGNTGDSTSPKSEPLPSLIAVGSHLETLPSSPNRDTGSELKLCPGCHNCCSDATELDSQCPVSEIQGDEKENTCSMFASLRSEGREMLSQGWSSS